METTSYNDYENFRAELPSEVLIYILEFVDLRLFLDCHLLCHSLNKNFTSTFNCYRIWYNYYRSKIKKITPEIEYRLLQEYRRRKSEIQYWKEKVKEQSIIKTENVRTINIFRKVDQELWYCCFSMDGNLCYGCGENEFSVYRRIRKDDGEYSQSFSEICDFKPSHSENKVRYGTFSPNGEKVSVIYEYDCPVYDLRLLGTNKCPLVENQSIPDRDDYLSLNTYYQNTKFQSSILSTPLDDLIDPSKSVDEIVEMEMEASGNRQINHEGLCHFARLGWISFHPEFVSDEHILFVPSERMSDSNHFRARESKGYEVIRIRLEKVNELFNGTKYPSKNSRNFSELVIHLDYENFIRKRVEVELSKNIWSTHSDPKRFYTRSRSFRQSTVEKTEKKNILFGFRSMKLPTRIGRCDMLLFVTLPSQFLKLLDGEMLDKQLVSEVDEVKNEKNCEMMLSQLDYIYVDGNVSETTFVENEVYVLHRPKSMDSTNVEILQPYYQLTLFCFKTKKKIHDFEPVQPKEFSPDSTFMIFVDVSDNYVCVGSERSVITIWDRLSRMNVGIIDIFDQPVSTVCFNPKDQRMFAAGSDDGTLRIMRFEEERVKVDSVLEEFKVQESKQKLREDMENILMD